MLCALLVASSISATATAAADRLQSRIWPSVSQAPASVRIEVVVPQDDDNRTLKIVVDSGDFFRSSTIDLEGADAPGFFSVQYRSMPAGAYEVDVELRGRTGTLIALEHHWLDVSP
jgi:hypothetical protein